MARRLSVRFARRLAHALGSLKPKTRNCILIRAAKFWARVKDASSGISGCGSLKGAVAQFGRAPRSQCGGQGFDPPLLHQNPPNFNYLQDRSKGLEFPNDQYVTKFFCLKLRLPFESVARSVSSCSLSICVLML